MRDIAKSQLVVYAAAAIAIALIGARYLRDEGGSGAAAARSPGARTTASHGVSVRAAGDALVVVHVAGAVRRPGVYRLRASDRVQDAVRLAGGATRHANLDGLNLAAKLEDGRQIVVPGKGAPAGVWRISMAAAMAGMSSTRSRRGFRLRTRCRPHATGSKRTRRSSSWTRRTASPP